MIAVSAAVPIGCTSQLGGIGGASDSCQGNCPLPCVSRPAVTQGPYFVDERLNRSDIRSDPSDGSLQPGIPLHLRLTVYQTDGTTCSAFPGATVDIWHANAEGVYSDEAVEGTAGQKFLRGYQVTDENGVVEFTTIYPGWYSGRTIHAHFKIRTFAGSSTTYDFTSQLFFDEGITAQVATQSPYNTRGLPDTTNGRDSIFDARLLLTLTPEGDGYLGTFDLGVRPQ
ncbi:MAG: intradiol ring-cleavage dioxygenase [Planctomycetes bacterium]|nr:intradiol ring-cleavage dioxygenase [Planctomycetota bacterium]MBI3833913.1 intradiol ring-cleavage dioxygenase [Planctomycetota bacterium]